MAKAKMNENAPLLFLLLTCGPFDLHGLLLPYVEQNIGLLLAVRAFPANQHVLELVHSNLWRNTDVKLKLRYKKLGAFIFKPGKPLPRVLPSYTQMTDTIFHLQP